MKKKNVKNWISLFVVASLTTACGAMKKNNSPGPGVSKNLSANAGLTSTFPEINLKNVDNTLGTWTASDGMQFEVVGKIAKQDGINIIGPTTEGYTVVGNLSITRQMKTYDSHYDGNDFLPTTKQEDEDYPKIKVYFGQTGAPETPMMILVSTVDYQSLGNGSSPINIEYAVTLMCTQFKVPSQPFFGSTSCLYGDKITTCQSFGNCTSSCDTANQLAAQYGVNYQHQMLSNAESPNCLRHAQLPTKSVSLENVSVISEIRIHPADEDKTKTSIIHISGQELN